MGTASETTYARQMEGCANGNIPSSCILSSAAAIGGVAACAALSAHFSADNRTTHKARYNGALWGLATGLTSGSLMLYLRGKDTSFLVTGPASLALYHQRRSDVGPPPAAMTTTH